MTDTNKLTDAQLQWLLQEEFRRDVEKAPRQHSQRTPECVSEPRLVAARKDNSWTEAERKHIFEDRCAFCLKNLDMLAGIDAEEADARTEVKPTGSNETAVTLPNPAQSRDYEAFHRRLAPLVPGLLWSAGLEPALAAEFLDYVKERVADFKGRHVSDALPVWLAEFARRQGASGTLDPDKNLAESVAVYSVLTSGEGEPEWAIQLRQAALAQDIRSAGELSRFSLPEAVASIPWAEGYVRDLCDEIERSVRDTLPVLQLTV